MRTPLTWQNVNPVSVREAGDLTDRAAQNFNRAFDTMGGMLTSQQNIAQAGIDRTHEAQVQAFLERLQGVRGVNDLTALQQTGELDTMRAALTPVNQARVRGEVDKRLTTLQTAEKAAFDFDAAAKERMYAPKLQAVRALIANGEIGKAKAFMAENPDMPQLDVLASSALQRERGDIEFLWKGDQQKRAGEQFLLEKEAAADRLKTNASQRASAEQSRLAALEATLVAREGRENARKQNEAAALTKQMKDNGNVWADGELKASDVPAVTELVKKYLTGATPEEQGFVIKQVGDFAANGVEVKYLDKDNKEQTKKMPVPLAMVQSALLGTGDQVMNAWNRGYRNNFRDAILNQVNRTEEFTMAPQAPAFTFPGGEMSGYTPDPVQAQTKAFQNLMVLQYQQMEQAKEAALRAQAQSQVLQGAGKTKK